MKRLLVLGAALISAQAQADDVKIYNLTNQPAYVAFYYDDGSNLANKDIGNSAIIAPSDSEKMVRPERKKIGFLSSWDRNIYFTHDKNELKDPILSDSVIRTKGQYYNIASAKGPFYIKQKPNGKLFADTKP